MSEDANSTGAPGVIFDLDGTLADTLRDIADAVNVSVGHFGLPPLPVTRVREFVGDGLSRLMARAGDTDDPDRVTALVARFRDHYRLNYLRHTKLDPGIEDALAQLRRAGCPIGVLSNKPHDFTRCICDELLPPGSLVAAAGACDQHPQKPDPTAALLLAQRMERPPGRVVIVGDSATDLNTARNAGMRSVAVTWGFRDRPALEAANPDAIVDRPEDLPAAILG